jgi:hypothetical protein
MKLRGQFPCELHKSIFRLLQPELAFIQLELAERPGIVQCFSIARKDVRPLAAERQLVLPPF